MCIVAIAWQLFEKMPLVLLSNRDEFYERSTMALHQWQDMPVYAGRDNLSGGTWLGYHQAMQLNETDSTPNDVDDTKDAATITYQNGRWAAVLNFRDGEQAAADQRTRGELVTDFITSTLSPMQFARQINLQAYAGFNLIVGDTQQAVVVNNRGYPPTLLHHGLHIFSNGQPDNEWFKCERLRGRVRQEVLPLIAESYSTDEMVKEAVEEGVNRTNTGPARPTLENQHSYWQPAAWDVLSDTLKAPDNRLPDTGMPSSLEKLLSSVCIDTPEMSNYGTRTQSLLTMTKHEDADSKTAYVMHLQSREYKALNAK